MNNVTTMNSRVGKAVLPLLILTALCQQAAAAGDADGLAISPKRQAFYAGSEFTVTVKGTAGATVSYRLTYANRTLRRGSVTLGKNGETALKLTFPDLKPGVVATSTLSCESADVKASKTLYFFAPTVPKGMVDELAIWHATGKDGVKKQLRAAGVPVKEIDDVSQAKAGAVVVHGMNLDDTPGTMDAFAAQCRTGKTIVLLNPAGTIVWPAKIDSVTLAGPRFVTDIDKRLNHLPSGNGLTVTQMDGKPALKTTAGTQGFCFCRMQLGKGELIILTCRIPESAQGDPTTTHLILKLTKNKEISK